MWPAIAPLSPLVAASSRISGVSLDASTTDPGARPAVRRRTCWTSAVFRPGCAGKGNTTCGMLASAGPTLRRCSPLSFTMCRGPAGAQDRAHCPRSSDDQRLQRLVEGADGISVSTFARVLARRRRARFPGWPVSGRASRLTTSATRRRAPGRRRRTTRVPAAARGPLPGLATSSLELRGTLGFTYDGGGGMEPGCGPGFRFGLAAERGDLPVTWRRAWAPSAWMSDKESSRST